MRESWKGTEYQYLGRPDFVGFCSAVLSTPCAQASGRTLGRKRESRGSCESASPCSADSMSKTFLTECEQAEATELYMLFARAVLLKLPREDKRSVAYPTFEGSSPAGAADNIADKCRL